jgi:hypothetical protein
VLFEIIEGSRVEFESEGAFNELRFEKFRARAEKCGFLRVLKIMGLFRFCSKKHHNLISRTKPARFLPDFSGIPGLFGEAVENPLIRITSVFKERSRERQCAMA